MAADTACAGQDAGSVSAVGGDLAALFALQDRARAMEAEILMIIETLDNMPGKPGAKGKLVDAEGFPRADVDIHTVRIHRNRLAYLQTDHQAAMKEIEQKLFAHHAALKNGGATLPTTRPHETPTPSGAVAARAPRRPPQPARPFAEIDEVNEDSPASSAGLRVGDRILRFGTIDSATVAAQGMAALAGLVGRNENQEIPVLVQHAGEASSAALTLIPRKWGGRGLLGCHLNPLPL